MRAALVAAVALAGLTAAGEAQAQAVRAFHSGNEMLSICDKNAAQCVGFAAGVADALSEVTAGGGNLQGFRACIPTAVTNGQARDVVVQFLRAHPEDRRFSAISQAARALAEAWPCPR